MGPKVGDKVGFVQLPPKASPKTAEKQGTARLPARPIEPELAELVGGNRSSVNRVLKRFEEQGLVTVHYGQVEILDGRIRS